MLEPQEESKRSSSAFGPLSMVGAAKPQRQDFFEDSLIVTSEEDIEFLKTLGKGVSEPPNLKTKLLYRGTRDGFIPALFHKMCDQKGPTVTLVRSSLGYTFGGYASINWVTPREEIMVMDKNSFVFSITHKSIHRIAQMVGYSVNLCKDFLPVFCGGFGISEFSKDGKCNKGISNLGGVYSCPPGYKYMDPKTQSYLAGAF